MSINHTIEQLSPEIGSTAPYTCMNSLTIWQGTTGLTSLGAQHLAGSLMRPNAASSSNIRRTSASGSANGKIWEFIFSSSMLIFLRLLSPHRLLCLDVVFSALPFANHDYVRNNKLLISFYASYRPPHHMPSLLSQPL